MVTNNNAKSSTSITIDGVTFKTEGNIVFSDTDETPYFLAYSSCLRKMEGILEHGMQTLLKKIRH